MPCYEEVLAQTYEVLERFAKGRTLSEDTELVAHLGLDSMRAMELLLETEDRFDISIPLNILPAVRTVRDFARELERLTSQR
jgi:acyl carrier protein